MLDRALLLHVRPELLPDLRSPKSAEQGIAEEEALKKGMEGESREFTEKGGELYAEA